METLKNLFGKDGIKTDNKVRVNVIIEDETYYKLGTTLVLVLILGFVMFFSSKGIFQK